jgi:Zn-dependent membrane protease YugP
MKNIKFNPKRDAMVISAKNYKECSKLNEFAEKYFKVEDICPVKGAISKYPFETIVQVKNGQFHSEFVTFKSTYSDYIDPNKEIHHLSMSDYDEVKTYLKSMSVEIHNVKWNCTSKT